MSESRRPSGIVYELIDLFVLSRLQTFAGPVIDLEGFSFFGSVGFVCFVNRWQLVSLSAGMMFMKRSHDSSEALVWWFYPLQRLSHSFFMF